MTSAGPTPENEGIDPELQAAVESAFEEVPDGVREGLAQGSPEGAAGQADAASDEATGEDPLAQAQAQAAQAADDLARARADLYNLQQEYQGFVRRSREGAASHRDAGAAGVVVRAVERLEAFAVGGAARVIAVNDGVAQSVAELVNAAPDDESWAQRIRVVPNGIDTTVFDAHGPTPSEQDRARIGLNGPYFVYAGTASEWQGADVFVHALAQVRRTHPKAQLLFLGRGTAWQEITQAASQLPAGPDGAPAVIMHPAVPAAEAAVWQRGAAAALVSIKPGQGYDFAYPTKVLSALGCGTPVLFAGRGPVSADVRDFDLGWAAEHDAAAVAEAMCTALDTYDAEIASGARPTTAQRFHDWVEDHRSLRATGQSAARVVQEAAGRVGETSEESAGGHEVRRVSEAQRW